MRNSCGCLLVYAWPCVPALLSVDNIVLGSWLTEGTWRHEIILCRAMCSPDRDREGVTLLPNLPPGPQAVLPAPRDTYAHSVFPLTYDISQDLSHLSNPLIEIPFILLLFCFPTRFRSIRNTWMFPSTSLLHWLKLDVWFWSILFKWERVTWLEQVCTNLTPHFNHP